MGKKIHIIRLLNPDTSHSGGFWQCETCGEFFEKKEDVYRHLGQERGE